QASFGYTESVYWARLKLENDRPREIQLYLELVSLIDDVTIFIINDQTTRTISYDRLDPLSMRSIRHRNFIYPVDLAPNSRSVIIMRFASEGGMLLPLTLWSKDAFAAKDHNEQIVYGLYFGIIAAMILYNLFVFFAVRSLSYLYYVLYISGFALILAGIWGFNHEYIFPEFPNAANLALPLSVGFTCLFAVQFTRSFLRTKTSIPRWDYFFRIVMLLAAAQMLITFMLSYGLAIRLGMYLGLLSVLIMFISSLVFWIRGYRPARYFFLAFIALLVGVVVLILRNLTVLPYHFLTNYASLIGSATEVMLFSLALADRINIMRAEKESIQSEALHTQQNMTNAFARFVPDQFLNFIGKDSITSVELGDAVRRRMTVLFTDIRDFTTLSESMSPEQNFQFINRYLSRMGPIIREHGGFIDKYIGDAIMALYPGSALSAIRAAIDLRRQLLEHNKMRSARGDAPMDIGIGMHTGDVMLGIIGERERMQSTVISDTVNVASRLEGLTRTFAAAIVISESCLRECLRESDATLLHRHLGRVRVKGKTEFVSIYEVFDSDPAELRQLKARNKESFEQAVQLANTSRSHRALEIFQQIQDRMQGHKDGALEWYLRRLREGSLRPEQELRLD
ncbi:MAG: guanylate cyclase, partial [Leptospiraceae bacterium]|nr:guanylate cyclase [Leptospiraceae bacterium]